MISLINMVATMVKPIIFWNPPFSCGSLQCAKLQGKVQSAPVSVCVLARVLHAWLLSSDVIDELTVMCVMMW